MRKRGRERMREREKNIKEREAERERMCSGTMYNLNWSKISACFTIYIYVKGSQ